MSSVYITDEIKKRFLVPFRALFAIDTEFPYNKDDASLSRILLSAKYPEQKTEGKLPHVTVSVNNYYTSTMTLNRNFHEEAGVRNDKTVTGRRFTTKINFTVGIDCFSTVAQEASKVADIIFNILNTHYAAEMSTVMGIDCRTIAVGEAQLNAQYPQYRWMSSVSVQGDMNLSSILYYPEDYGNILKGIGIDVKLDLKD